MTQTKTWRTVNFQAGSLITVCYSALEALGSWSCFSCYLSFKFKQGLEGNILKSRVKCSMHEGQYNCKSPWFRFKEISPYKIVIPWEFSNSWSYTEVYFVHDRQWLRWLINVTFITQNSTHDPLYFKGGGFSLEFFLVKSFDTNIR